MIIGGRSKTLKTSLACDLAISLGSGTPFLGRFDAHRVGVGFLERRKWGGDDPRDGPRIADSKGVDLADVDVVCGVSTCPACLNSTTSTTWRRRSAAKG